MSSQSNIPPPVPRLDAARIVEELNRQHGISLELLGAAPGGEVGAAFVRWPDGHEGVLTRAADAPAGAGEHLRSTTAMLALVKTRGIPVPRYELVVQVDDLYAVVQERLPGAPPDVVDGPLVGLAACSARFARSAGPGRVCWPATIWCTSTITRATSWSTRKAS
ncbi:hypothetical protein [Kribbella catacumbae]|uniref:hypothetical protein n=1 Tax=Kribbella catacumbae TaxID=460086 RepID=UPI0003A0A4B8|nr:hypothetical protein [Kribbella catacumbae]